MAEILEISRDLISYLLIPYLLLILTQLNPFFKQESGTSQNPESKKVYILLFTTTYLSNFKKHISSMT